MTDLELFPDIERNSENTPLPPPSGNAKKNPSVKSSLQIKAPRDFVLGKLPIFSPSKRAFKKI